MALRARWISLTRGGGHDNCPLCLVTDTGRAGLGLHFSGCQCQAGQVCEYYNSSNGENGSTLQVILYLFKGRKLKPNLLYIVPQLKCFYRTLFFVNRSPIPS